MSPFVETAFDRYIKQRIKRNKNLLMLVAGDTGSGKSWTALAIAERVDEDFNEEKIIFTYDELIDVVETQKFPKGSCIIFDEASAEALQARDFMSRKNKSISALLQTFRNMNYVVIFTSPDMSFIDRQARSLLHMILVTRDDGINYQANLNSVKVYMIRKSIFKGGFKYFNILRWKDHATGEINELSTLLVPKPRPNLIKAYELKKHQFQKKLYRKLRKHFGEKEL